MLAWSTFFTAETLLDLAAFPQFNQRSQKAKFGPERGQSDSKDGRSSKPPYLAGCGPVPPGPGTAGLPAPTPMPAPGTEMGDPCASFDPCTAGGGGLMRAPSDVIMHETTDAPMATQITSRRMMSPAQTDADATTTAPAPGAGANADMNSRTRISRIVVHAVGIVCRCSIATVGRGSAAGKAGQRQERKKSEFHDASGTRSRKLEYARK